MFRLLLLASAVASALAITCETGPGQQNQIAVADRCYYYVSTEPKKNWNDAKQHCIDTYTNGHLVIIMSAQLNQVLRDLITGGPGQPKPWIGLSKSVPGNPQYSYEWVDDTALTVPGDYTNFNPGEEPNRPNFDDKCVHMQRGNGKWFNRECSELYSMLCEGDPVDNGGARDPHLMVQLHGSDDPVCFDLKGKENEKYQLVYDPDRDLTINCAIVQLQNTSHSWFKAIAIMEDDCEITMDIRKIIVNSQSVPWDIPARNQACGRSATYSVTPEGHLVVQMAGNLQVTLRRDETMKYDVRFLDFYMTQHHDLSPLSHGLLGQFQGARISLKPLDEKKSVIRFENDHSKPMSIVTKRMRRNVLPGAVAMPCWFSGFQGYGIIDGAISDYLVESLTFQGIAPKLEQFAKFDVNRAPGDDVIDGLF